jgi:hypothetical protein
MTNRTVGIALVGLIVVLAVIYAAVGGTPTQGSSNAGSVYFDISGPDPPDPGHELIGRAVISIAPSALEDPTLSDVLLCLYDDDGTVMKSTSLGTVEEGSASVSVALETETATTYVLVHHPEFYRIETLGGISHEVLVYRPDAEARTTEGRHVIPYYPEGPDVLPFDPATLPGGSCRPSS